MWTIRCVKSVLTLCWTTWTHSSTSQKTSARITSEFNASLVNQRESIATNIELKHTNCGCISRQCLELLSHLQVEEEETLLAELQQLKEEEEALVQELEAVEEQRAVVAQELAQSKSHSQQLDTEELQ